MAYLNEFIYNLDGTKAKFINYLTEYLISNDFKQVDPSRKSIKNLEQPYSSPLTTLEILKRFVRELLSSTMVKSCLMIRLNMILKKQSN